MSVKRQNLREYKDSHRKFILIEVYEQNGDVIEVLKSRSIFREISAKDKKYTSEEFVSLDSKEGDRIAVPIPLEGAFVSVSKYNEIAEIYQSLKNREKSKSRARLGEGELKDLIDFGKLENYQGDKGIVIYLNSDKTDIKRSGLVNSD